MAKKRELQGLTNPPNSRFATTYAHRSAVCPTSGDVTKIARMASAKPMNQGFIFPLVATLQQSHHVRSASSAQAAGQLRTKVSTGPA
jgi:hypothetical protein